MILLISVFNNFTKLHINIELHIMINANESFKRIES